MAIRVVESVLNFIIRPALAFGVRFLFLDLPRLIFTSPRLIMNMAIKLKLLNTLMLFTIVPVFHQ